MRLWMLSIMITCWSDTRNNALRQMEPQATAFWKQTSMTIGSHICVSFAAGSHIWNGPNTLGID